MPRPRLARRRRMVAFVRRLFVGVLAVAVVAAAAAARPTAPPFRLSACVVQGVSARCGTFSVPENRARPNGRKIGLNVVLIPAAQKPALADAFTYLAGGPGTAATDLTSWVAQTFPGIHTRHDILLVDQRGTGMSNLLTCASPSHPLNTAAQKRAYARACLDSLGGDVRQYGTRTAMDDLDAVRRALGYRRLDIYGTSYGATAAQAYLKQYPSSVRTIVLDGATAVDVPFYGRYAINAQAALDQVAKRCTADPACRKAFPEWRKAFGELVRAWDRRPIQNRPGETTTGSGLAGVVQYMLIDATRAAEIPLVVTRAARGDYTPLNRNIPQGAQAGSGSLNLEFYSIWCNEPWVGLNVRGPWHTDFDTNEQAQLTYHRSICAYVPSHTEPASAWTLPHSMKPLLLLAGGADPQDPITNMPRLEQAFPNSRAIVVPNYGHTVGQYGCLGGLVSSFVNSGSAATLDTGCVNAIRPPNFALR